MKDFWAFFYRILFRVALGLATAILFVKMLVDAIVIEPTTSRIIFAGFDLYLLIAFACIVALDLAVFQKKYGSDE